MAQRNSKTDDSLTDVSEPGSSWRLKPRDPDRREIEFAIDEKRRGVIGEDELLDRVVATGMREVESLLTSDQAAELRDMLRYAALTSTSLRECLELEPLV